MNMAEKVKYDNIWTKLHLGGVRGSKLFKRVWRALRVGGLTALLFFKIKNKISGESVWGRAGSFVSLSYNYISCFTPK